MDMVQVVDLVKTYNKGALTAVDHVDFSVKKGELFGLIGPDGAGKTSIFRILTTLLMPTEGAATVAGLDVVKEYKQIRKLVGYMPGKFSLYQDLTIEENLNFFASVFGTTVEENYDLIKDIYVQIEPFKDRRAGKLSGGMKQKLALCCALIHKPVDVVSRKEFWEMLARLKDQGITILVSTPYMDEATLCERIALIQNGQILSVETPEEIIKQYPDPLYAIKANNMGKLLVDLRNNPNIKTCNAFGEYHHISFKEDQGHAKEMLLKSLENQNHQGLIIDDIQPNIEDCFINLMN